MTLGGSRWRDLDRRCRGRSPAQPKPQQGYGPVWFLTRPGLWAELSEEHLANTEHKANSWFGRKIIGFMALS